MKVTAAALVASLGPAAAFVSTSSFAPRTAQGAGVRHASPLQMSIAVFGASGLLGSEVTYQALQRGEDVIAFLRDPSKLVVPAGSGGPDAGKPLKSDKLKVVQGSVVSYDDVTKAFAGGDVTGVVVALGGKTKDVGKTMLTDGTSNIIKAMKANGVKRIAAVTSIGAGDSENQAPFFFKVLMFTVMKNIFEDKNNQEALFTRGPGSDLEFTIVRPGGLTVEPPTGVINVISGEAGSISRADVADFCLGAVLEEGFPYLRKVSSTQHLHCLSTTNFLQFFV